MMELHEFANRTVTIERILDAPIDIVWEAWTNPEHIALWWSPKGVKTIVEIHEFKIGGHWKYIMPMPNGKEFIAEGIYTIIEPKTRIKSSADFRPMTEGVEIETILKAKGEQTHFVFHIIHPTESYKEKQERMGIQNGWGSVFDRLDELLNQIKK
ncbi:MAG: SRPBCC domain-containing protein [Bacteroidota bacterium]